VSSNLWSLPVLGPDRQGQLSIVSQNFRRSATEVRKRMWWKNAKVSDPESACEAILCGPAMRAACTMTDLS
jgi:hypothetical protein